MKNIKNIKLIIVGVVIFILAIGGYFAYKHFFLDEDESSVTSVSEIDQTVDLDTSDEDIDWSSATTTDITLTESLTITEEGIYTLSGTIDGMVTIDTDGEVKLVLNGVTIKNSNGPAIMVESADTVVISTVSGTTNTLSDSSSYSGYDDDVEGAIYSKDDLVLEGSGTLVVTGNKGDAIVCKDDLKINSGTYKITSADDGIRGKDSVYILDGSFIIKASGDGIKSTNDSESDKGYVKIEDGDYTITAEMDGIQAETKVIISDGTFTITTGGGSSNSSTSSSWGIWSSSSSSSDSAKGIKAGDNIVLSGGTYTLNTSDDGIHSNNYVGISGGTFNISSGDDGIHADSTLVIDAGVIKITKSYEGLEAASVSINGGTISIVSSDDGINAAGGADSSGTNRPGASMGMNTSSNSSITINGGTITVAASGDGIDANGSIYLNGGSVIIDGSISQENGALDYDQEFKVTGGTILALGPSSMAQGTSSSSTQYGFLLNLGTTYSANSKITLEDSSGNVILSYTTNTSFSSIVYSDSSLSSGSFTLKIDGTTIKTFSLSSTSTTVGNSSMGGNVTRR